MAQSNPACNILKSIKEEVVASSLPDKEELAASIDRLMEIKHCNGRRR